MITDYQVDVVMTGDTVITMLVMARDKAITVCYCGFDT